MRDEWVDTMLCAWRGRPVEERDEVLREMHDEAAYSSAPEAWRVAMTLLRALEAA